MVQADSEQSVDPHVAGEAADAGGMERDNPAQIDRPEGARGPAAQAAGDVAAGVTTAVEGEIDGLAQGLAVLFNGGGIAGDKDLRVVRQGEVGGHPEPAVAQAFHLPVDLRHGKARAGRPAEKDIRVGLSAGDGMAAIEGFHGGAEADFHALIGQKIQDVLSLRGGQGREQNRGGVHQGDAARAAGGLRAGKKAQGQFKACIARAGHQEMRGRGGLEILDEVLADAQGVAQGSQHIQAIAGEGRSAGVWNGSGRNQQMVIGQGFAAGRDRSGVKIDGGDPPGEKANAGRKPFAQGAPDQPLGHPAAGDIGEGGQHGGHGAGVDEHGFHPCPGQRLAGLESGESSTDNERFAMHDLGNYCRFSEMQNGWKQFEEAWDRLLAGHPLGKDWAESDPEGYGQVAAALRLPGKRMRPLLFYTACRAWGCDPLPDWMPAALALELVHAFILIHDDVMDGSATRRGEATLPLRLDSILAGRGAGGFRGGDLALVAGDLLYSLAMESLLRVRAPAEKIVAAMQAAMEAALDTGRGAWMEIRAARTPLAEVGLDDIEAVYALKTGSYSFALPLRMAAVCSGGGRDFPFTEFGKHAGLAYQLMNDRAGLRPWLEGGRLPDDLRDRRRIWGIVRAWCGGDAETRALLEAPPGEALRDWIRTGPVIGAMEEAIRDHSRHAIRLAERPEIQTLLRDVFHCPHEGAA